MGFPSASLTFGGQKPLSFPTALFPAEEAAQGRALRRAHPAVTPGTNYPHRQADENGGPLLSAEQRACARGRRAARFYYAVLHMRLRCSLRPLRPRRLMTRGA